MKTYTGVQLNKFTKLYQAKVTHCGTIYSCGSYPTPEAAAKARDIKIIEKNLPFKLQILKPKKP